VPEQYPQDLLPECHQSYKMRVIATAPGFYGKTYRVAGDIFEYTGGLGKDKDGNETILPVWMTRAEPETSKAPETPKVPETSKAPETPKVPETVKTPEIKTGPVDSPADIFKI